MIGALFRRGPALLSREAGGERWLMAVSYTHLDVYKRQASAAPITPSAADTQRPGEY